MNKKPINWDEIIARIFVLGVISYLLIRMIKSLFV
jgi:hypothetical protein